MHNQPQAETDWDYLDKLVHKADKIQSVLVILSPSIKVQT